MKVNKGQSVLISVKCLNKKLYIYIDRSLNVEISKGVIDNRNIRWEQIITNV